MKMLWTGIESIISLKAKNQLSHISHLKSNDSCVTDPAEMANLFEHYFVNVGSNIDKKIPRTKKSPLAYLKKRISNSLFLSPTTPEEIETIIQSSNVKKSYWPLQYSFISIKNSEQTHCTAHIINR